MSALAIVAFFVALIAIIMIHEGGHYLTARLYRFRVLEYFVGFGPKLWSFRRGEIEYGVKAVPAGGYVKIAGMDPFNDDVPPGDEDRAYTAKPVWQRAIVILAGPMSHFLVAGLIFAALLFFVGDGWRVKVNDVTPTIAGAASPAAAAGLRPGDTIVRIGDVQDPSRDQLGAYLASHAGQEIPVTVQRDGSTFDVTIKPVYDASLKPPIWRIGVVLGPVPRPLFGAITGGAGQVAEYTKVSLQQIGHVFGPGGIHRIFTLLFTNASRNGGDATSVVGVSQQVGAIGGAGNWAAFFFVFAYITLFIGLVNLVPLPPFDGGHLAILLIEKVRGRRIDMRKVVPVSAAVLVFLGFFVLSTMLLDVVKPIPISP
ncbi:MAG TPA: M50 family metallopeptidase [Actinomycetota bacterium]|nr:M50 family metallopeptidase [Actinomycetota bacterium]